MNNNENKQNQDIEVVIGDDSILEISEVGDCMNELRPKSSDKKSKNPKTNKKDESKDSENE